MVVDIVVIVFIIVIIPSKNKVNSLSRHRVFDKWVQIRSIVKGKVFPR